jgi:uncharacterized membrane protein
MGGFLAMNDELQLVIFYLSLSNTGVGLLIVAVAIPLILRKVPMNPWYGVRFASSYKSDWLWYEINEYGGKLLAAMGLIWSAYGVAGFWAESMNYVWGTSGLALGLSGVLALLCHQKGKKLERQLEEKNSPDREC